MSVIPLNRSQLERDIIFWTQQSKDHCLFLYLKISDSAPEIKMKAHSLYRDFDKVDEDSDLTIIERVRDLLAECKKLQMRPAHPVTGPTLGPLPVGMIDHMLKETDYFIRRVTEKTTTVDQELKFWTQEAAEHHLLTAHMLDPTEMKRTNDNINIAMKLEDSDVKSLLETLRTGSEAALQLLDDMKENRVLTLLSIMELQHEIHENEYRDIIFSEI